MVFMNVTMPAQPRNQLITDIFTPAATNRRRHAMDEETLVPHVQPASDHHCYEDQLHSHSPLSLSAYSELPTALYTLKLTLPKWAPRKFTIKDGVKTNWRALLPSKQPLTKAGVLTSFLVIAAFAVWALPQKYPSHVIAEGLTQASGNAKQETVTQGNFSTVSHAAAAPQANNNQPLRTGHTSSANSHPAVIPQVSVAPPPITTPEPSGGTLSADTPTPPTSSEPPVEPTQPPTPVVDPPADPPTDPVVPPVDPPVANP